MTSINKAIPLIIATTLTSVSAQAQTSAVPVYNQAYQENYAADQKDQILKDASNAYVLLDPDADDTENYVAALKANGNQVAAYISIGTGEDWRSDFVEMRPYLVKQAWAQWQGEFFVSKVEEGLYAIMQARIDKIAKLGFDWIEFDNMDWAFDDELRTAHKFEVTQQQSIEYFQKLCDYVHKNGMKCMAKNQPEFVDKFDGITFESYEDDKNWWDVEAAKKIAETQKLFIVVHYDAANCLEVYEEYKSIYSNDISFICESSKLKKYVHFNQ